MQKTPSTSIVLIALLTSAIGCNTQPAPQTAAPESAASSAAASAASIPGPVSGTRMTEDYVRHVGAMAYLWGWPMVNIHNRKTTFEKIPGPGMMGGIVPVAPSNQIGMLRDYIVPQERVVACPNQDVVYGFSILDLAQEPVVIQVPDFGDRFWVYQVVDQRTDSFAQLGKMYGTKPGFYLLAGPDWKGTTPNGIAGVFRSKTSLGIVIPRAFMDDTDEDRKAIQPVLQGILLYPLSKFTGQTQTKDWAAMPNYPAPSQGQEETKWVVPETFFDLLPAVMKEVPPLPGEEALYANIQSVLDAASKDPKLHAALVSSAVEADKNLITPLFQFHNWGIPLPHNWTTQNNGAEFGTDYFTRAAVAKSNIFVNAPRETKYFYQDLDGDGQQLNGNHAYTVTFAAGQLPPVKGFWSLTLYNQNHFFSPNEIKRYSVGTKNKTLVKSPDGSLTIYVQSTPPEGDKKANWLPAPKENIALYTRAYWPEEAALNGTWTPPVVTKVK
ncbi:DUF1254 domain-containing protein [Edaphobacter aggregans]|uniref:DUF1254 domain-containing protein n=1 Tax=Edaphobacter aggregans TaxID=570835 RepID=UPI0005553204|nr:DUF1254 domain-containing protein [Edaphobacter aggregans]